MATLDFLMEALENSRSEEQQIYGLGIGRVINNIDATGMARVQVSLPWLPGIEPWARIVDAVGRRSARYLFHSAGR